MSGFGIGICLGFVGMGILIGDNGVNQLKKEAEERGYMEKQINSEDKIIYVWKEK